MGRIHRGRSLLGALLLAGAAPAQEVCRLVPPGCEALPVAERLGAWVRALSAPELAGRRAGSPGAVAAAFLVAEEFCRLGLEPAGTGGSFLQELPLPAGGGTHNVLGFLPGRSGEVVVLSAHYDHLGLGGPESRWAGGPALHPGADDNASGVACLLGLAGAFGPHRDRLGRSLLFAAWGAEEQGGLGARWWVGHSTVPLDRVVAVVNLDMVGRGAARLVAAGAASASGLAAELEALAPGVGLVPASFGGSDHEAFLERRIPAVHLFTGAGEDYHTPGDTPDKVDFAGVRAVGAVAFRLAAHLSLRPGRPEFDPAGYTDRRSLKPKGRRPSLGTAPDFAQSRGGYRVARVAPGSPAAAAGLQPGDLIVELAGRPVDGFLDFVAALYAHEPGEEVAIAALRGRERVAVTAVLAGAPERPAPGSEPASAPASRPGGGGG